MLGTGGDEAANTSIAVSPVSEPRWGNSSGTDVVSVDSDTASLGIEDNTTATLLPYFDAAAQQTRAGETGMQLASVPQPDAPPRKRRSAGTVYKSRRVVLPAAIGGMHEANDFVMQETTSYDIDVKCLKNDLQIKQGGDRNEGSATQLEIPWGDVTGVRYAPKGSAPAINVSFHTLRAIAPWCEGLTTRSAAGKLA
eukprot:SAG11_NODE_10911_length_797_cov_1.020057_1_plen_195_part_01